MGIGGFFKPRGFSCKMRNANKPEHSFDKCGGQLLQQQHPRPLVSRAGRGLPPASPAQQPAAAPR
eukprot:12746702-Alexandrium_andersonii.AAC.1